MGAISRHHQLHKFYVRKCCTWGILGLALPFLFLFCVFPIETLFYKARHSHNVVISQLRIPFRPLQDGRLAPSVSLTQGDGGLYRRPHIHSHHKHEKMPAYLENDEVDNKSKQIKVDQSDAENPQSSSSMPHETIKNNQDHHEENISKQMTRKAMGVIDTSEDSIAAEESESTEDHQREAGVSSQRKADQTGEKMKKKGPAFKLGADDAFTELGNEVKDFKSFSKGSASHGKLKKLVKSDQVIKSGKGGARDDEPIEELMDLQSEAASYRNKAPPKSGSVDDGRPLRRHYSSRSSALTKDGMDSDAEEHAEKMMKEKKIDSDRKRKQIHEEKLDELMNINADRTDVLSATIDEVGNVKARKKQGADDDDDEGAEVDEGAMTSRVIGKTLPSLAIRSRAKCSLWKGRWIHDKRVHVKSNLTCPWSCPIEGKDCKRYVNQRDLYSWRWQPSGCKIDDFEAPFFLKLMQNKSLAFVGDNLAKSQMVSLLCLLSQVETPMLLYDDNSNKSMSWHFSFSKFTLLMIWSPNLVQGVVEQGYRKLHLDKLDTNWAEQVPRLDVVVLGVGPLFMEPTVYVVRNEIIGCYACQDIPSFVNTKNIREISLYSGFRASMRSTILGVGALPGYRGIITFIQPFGFQGNGSYIKVSMRMKEILEEEVKNAYKRGSIMNESIMEVLETTLLHESSSGAHFLKGPNLACIEPSPFVDTWNHFLQHTLKSLSS